MNDISGYIYGELQKIPFNLLNLISQYSASHKGTKVAFVGGYIRDLLITKLHKKVISKPVDIDLVIEGSSISLAKFIKKNISNVEICLIKEFYLYDTVELNINELKIDIASAREEIYYAPGFNPKVTRTTIEKDLKRRDFTINSIAYEVSEKKIYDIHQGISHIRSKELHLLHRNSIKDDPSRLIRCAKYASRLDFNISKDSLKQSQETVGKWPWGSYESQKKLIFPPAISIRIRMELSEINKYDNLANIIINLQKWGIHSIINENIWADKRFERGLRWIKRFEGNYLLYLLKNSEDLEITCQRFFINNKERRIIEDYLNIKKNLRINREKYLNFSPSNWTEFIEKRNLNEETVKLIISDGGLFWRAFFRWLFVYRFIKSNKDGKLLISEGWKPGKEMGNEIKRLRYLEIDKIRKK